MALTKKGIRSRDALRVSVAALRTLRLPGRAGTTSSAGASSPSLREGPYRLRVRSVRSLRDLPHSPSDDPCGVPCPPRPCVLRGARRWRACALSGRLLARSQPLAPWRPAGLCRAPGARVCDGWGRCPVVALLRSAGIAVGSPPVTGLVSGDSSLAALFEATGVAKDIPTLLSQCSVDPAALPALRPGSRRPPGTARCRSTWAGPGCPWAGRGGGLR